MLANLSVWWLNLGGVGFFATVHLLGALVLILSLTVAELLWAVRPMRTWSGGAANPPPFALPWRARIAEGRSGRPRGHHGARDAAVRRACRRRRARRP